MQLKLPELSKALQQSLARLYLISGDEPLLVEQAQAEIRTACHQKGFLHREIITIQNAANWDQLFSHYASADLFSEKKIIDIRNPNNKFDSKGQHFFEHISHVVNPDCIVMISSAKLTAAQKRTKWFKNIERTGVIINIWPIPSYELPKWIAQQLKKRGLNASQDSIQLLATLTEGNLLATHQGLTKLQLLYPKERIDCEHVIKATHDTARFNVFDLSNYALLGNHEKTIRVIRHLQQSGLEPTLVLWALTREIRLLHALLHANSDDSKTLLRREWQSRQRLLSNAARRLRPQQMSALLQHASQVDKVIKGNLSGNIWLSLSELALGICGTPLTVSSALT